MSLFGTLLVGLAATAVPRFQSEDLWGVVRAAELSAEAGAALAALNTAAEAPFRVQVLPNGRAHVLHGGAWHSGTGEPAAAALRFLTAYGPLFGIPHGASWLDLQADVVLAGSAPTRAYSRFLLNGLPLEGADCVVLFDEEGRIVGATGSGPELFQAIPTFALAEHQVADTAWSSVRAATQRTAPAAWLDPEIARVYLATSAGVRPAYRFDISSTTGAQAYAVYVDARDGRELQRIDRIHHMDGKWPHNGGFVKFGTKTAMGKVYRDQADALAGIATKQGLEGWSTGVPKPVKISKGYLVGSRAAIFNEAGPFVFKSSGSFLFNPRSEPDRFDQVNAYYQVESFYGHLRATLGTALGSDFSLPVVVNVKTAVVNAYFSPALFPPTQHTQGYIVLNDMSDTLGPAADISRDPTVVHHEYTHAWVHFEHEAFQGDLDYPTRAVGEAVADFYALAFNKDGAIGRYIAQVALAQPFMRDLRDDDHFPETVLDAMALTLSGLPEEHRSGEVIGAMLLDLRSAAGTKTAEKLVFAALPAMPNHMGPVGYPLVTPANAVEATGVYFATCVTALLASGKTSADVQDILGSATGRGVLGDPASEVEVFVNLEKFPNRKATIPSRFVVPTGQSFFFKANPGRLLRVKISGAPSGTVQPDFAIAGVNGEPNPTRGVDPKQFSGGGQVVEQTGIELLLPKGSVYEIQVTTQPGTSGQYTLLLDV